MKFVEVEFDHVALEGDYELLGFFNAAFDAEKLIKGTGNYARLLGVALDCEGLAWACLTVGEDADVEAINGALHEHFGVFENFILACILAKAAVELVLLFFVALALDAIFL